MNDGGYNLYWPKGIYLNTSVIMAGHVLYLGVGGIKGLTRYTERQSNDISNTFVLERSR